ncbi:hypothetical protein ACN082_05220 [Rothia sp. CCM 9417]
MELEILRKVELIPRSSGIGSFAAHSGHLNYPGITAVFDRADELIPDKNL